MRGRQLAERYYHNLRKQQAALEKFAAHETEWASDLISWYRARKEDMPDDEYRACAYFINKEYLSKPGSLTLCYEMHQRTLEEFPKFEKEFAFDLLRYRYKCYSYALQKGGFS